MSKTEKAIAKMKQNPLGWRIEDLQAVARHHGVEWRHDGSSHCIFIFGMQRILSVPAKRPIKPFYIKEFLARLEAMK